MANIYYANLGNWHGKYYRLYYYPADTADLTSITEIELPKNFIISWKLTRNFDNDLFLGFEKIPTLNLKMNLNALSSSLKTAILLNETAAKVTAYVDWDGVDKDYSIPSRWKIKTGIDGSTFTNVVFEGVQERIKQYKNSPDGTHEINVTDILSTILLNMNIADIGNEIHSDVVATNSIDELVYWIHNDGSKYFFVSNSSTDWLSNNIKYVYETLPNLFDKIATIAGLILQIYRRNEVVSSVGFIDYPLSHWRFFKQNYTDYNDTGDAITDESDLTYINSIYIEGDSETIIGGTMSNTESKASWGKDHKNCYNLLKFLAESLLCKIKIYYFNTGAAKIICNPIFSCKDGNGSAESNIALSSEKIVNDWEIIQGAEFEESVCHITNCNEEDLSEFSSTNNQLSQDEDSFEVKNILHNNFCNPRTGKFSINHKEDWLDGSLSRLPTSTSVVQIIGFKDATIDGSEIRLIKVSEKCNMFIDGSQYEQSGLATMNPDSDFDFWDGSYLKKIENVALDFYKKMGLERGRLGMPFLTAFVLNKYLNTKKQAIIKFKTDLRYINTNDIGLSIELDIPDLLGYTGNYTTRVVNGVITSVEIDETGFVNVIAFIRGE